MVAIGVQGRMNTTVNYQIRLVNKDKVNATGRLKNNMCWICGKLVTPIRRGE